MVQGINKEYIFKTNEEKNKYLELLKKYYLEFEIDIIAYCIMDNHAHMLLYSEKIQNISNFMRQINSIYAMHYNKKKDRVGYVYRNRFESVPIMTREQMYTCIKYISSLENYIKIFQNIEYKNLNLDRESYNIEKLYKNFLLCEEITLSEMRKNKILIQRFMNYLNLNQYKFSKTEIARILKISRATLYRLTI